MQMLADGRRGVEICGSSHLIFSVKQENKDGGGGVRQ